LSMSVPMPSSTPPDVDPPVSAAQSSLPSIEPPESSPSSQSPETSSPPQVPLTLPGQAASIRSMIALALAARRARILARETKLMVFTLS
jgi:hypothetical protein